MCCCERPIFFGDLRHIGARVEDPSPFGCAPLRKEDDVGLGSFAIWTECAARQSEDRVKVAVLHQNLKDIARLIRKQDIVWNDDCGPATWFENCQHVLKKVELLIACRDSEIVPFGSL